MLMVIHAKMKTTHVDSPCACKNNLRGMENSMNRKGEIYKRAFLFCAGLTFVFPALSATLRAQTSQTLPFASTQNASTPPASDTASTPQAEPDLAITAHVTARELRFDQVPNTRVDFTGRPKRETVWDATRQNLPRPVQPGVTYRNIGIQLKITSVFADIDRIVAEALGEVPATDNSTPEENRPAPSPQSSAPPSPTPADTLPLSDSSTKPNGGA